MDFPLEEAIRQALENDGNYWGGGMVRVYDALAQDYQYADVNNLLLFVGNHDTERFADVVLNNDPRRVYIGHLLTATMRGIPQVFSGDEYMQRSADRAKGHSGLRQPLPQESELTAEQKAFYDQMRTLFNWRKEEPVLWTGKTMHFISRDNTYAYVRYNQDEAVLVYINASDEKRTMPVDHYREILDKYSYLGFAPLNHNHPIDLNQPQTLAPLSTLVVKLVK